MQGQASQPCHGLAVFAGYHSMHSGSAGVTTREMFEEPPACQMCRLQPVAFLSCLGIPGKAHLDLQPDPSAGSPVLVDVHDHVLGHRACHPAAPQQGVLCLLRHC